MPTRTRRMRAEARKAAAEMPSEETLDAMPPEPSARKPRQRATSKANQKIKPEDLLPHDLVMAIALTANDEIIVRAFGDDHRMTVDEAVGFFAPLTRVATRYGAALAAKLFPHGLGVLSENGRDLASAGAAFGKYLFRQMATAQVARQERRKRSKAQPVHSATQPSEAEGPNPPWADVVQPTANGEGNHLVTFAPGLTAALPQEMGLGAIQ